MFCLFKHAWDGCVCTKCGKKRDEEHAWNGCVCTKCGKKRDEEHTWDGCVCTKCGKKRDEEHTWDGCVCTKCRKKRDSGHNWQPYEPSDHTIAERCARCGEVRNERNHCPRCGTFDSMRESTWTSEYITGDGTMDHQFDIITEQSCSQYTCRVCRYQTEPNCTDIRTYDNESEIYGS